MILLRVKTAIFALSVGNFVTLLNSNALAEQTDELLTSNTLVGKSYSGEDQLHRRVKCSLVVGTELRDAFGRLYRDFTVTVAAPAALNYPIRIVNPPKNYSPSSRPDSSKLIYMVPLDGYRMKVTTLNTDTTEILEFLLEDVRGVTGHPGPLVNCINVKH